MEFDLIKAIEAAEAVEGVEALQEIIKNHQADILALSPDALQAICGGGKFAAVCKEIYGDNWIEAIVGSKKADFPPKSTICPPEFDAFVNPVEDRKKK